eukprot:gene4696-5311_t
MEKETSELMLLCTRTAPQLRTLRAVQFENKDISNVNLMQQLDWVSKNAAVVEEDDDNVDDEKFTKDNESKSKCDQQNNKVPRPMNSFMVFSHLERKRLAEENPELHNADLSKILGKKWKTLTPGQRQPYIDEAERLRVLHTETFPDYKYKPRRRKHPKRNTKKFSTLTPNDVKLKMKVALTLDCALPAATDHPLDVVAGQIANREGCEQLQFQNSPLLEHLHNGSEASTVDPTPPTPEDSPAAAQDMQDVELGLSQAPQQKMHNTVQDLSFSTTANIYSFLPPTPELSPVITSANRATLCFDYPTVIKTEQTAMYSGCLLTESSVADVKIAFNTSSAVSLPTISSFGSIYTMQEEASIIPPQPTSAAKIELFSDVDRDEFDQYLGAPLEKTQLSNSLRNIIQELEENYNSS